MEQLRLDLSHYERQCPTCKGTGKDPRDRPYMDPRRITLPWEPDRCPDCSGKGFHLTPEGRRFVSFLRRWLIR